ncbi:MAG: EAL domain-containing protein [Sedimentibacter sp.]|uniref:sensor domain-containing protein n=1 Tax=Sedimentibacter sp. TaxID=1960295 RepID=UPI0031590E01
MKNSNTDAKRRFKLPVEEIEEVLKEINPLKEALTIVVLYGLFGVLWILLSDNVLDMFASDMETYKLLQTWKGWFYVLITVIFAFFLIKSRVSRIKNASEDALDAYKKLIDANEEQEKLANELIYQKDLIHSIIEDAPVLIVIWDEDGRAVKANSCCNILFGCGEGDIDGAMLNEKMSAAGNGNFTEHIREVLQNGKVKEHETSVTDRDSGLRDILWSSSAISHEGGKKTIVSIGIDITERKRFEDNIRRMAYHDSLTGLPNRDKFVMEIERMAEEQRGLGKFAVAFLDIDNFKYINDTLGHPTGDEFLVYVSKELSSAVKNPDMIARLGGDEFGILVTCFENEEELVSRLECIKNSLGSFWISDNREFLVSMSIGAAVYPHDGTNASTLLKNSDIAMNVAKKDGKNKSVIYKRNIHEDIIWHIQMSNKLQKALDNKEFMLYYQPQIELSTGKIVGLEALVRWKHPDEGFISPADFIPVAEETGQIYLLEQRIVKNALIQKMKWDKSGFNDVVLSLNLSSKTLISDSNFRQIEAILEDFDMDYSKIVFEITETVLISNIELAMERLNKLKEIGLQIALDDFGTGYSSITYLKKFPIDIIKLDKSFVNSITGRDRDVSIVKFILLLANDLNMSVVAEGIESADQLEYLKIINCQMGQGYYIGMPSPAEDISILLEQREYEQRS